MTEKKQAESGTDGQASEGSNAGRSKLGIGVGGRPGVFIDAGPKNKLRGTLEDDRTELLLTYDHQALPQQYETEEFGVTLPDTLSWKSAWLRAVSLAWSDEKKGGLRDQLCENPYKFIHNFCGYSIPKTVSLVVIPDKLARFAIGENDTNSWAWYLTQSVLVMYLPEKPQDEDALIALASYEAVGCAYPFTATC